MNNWNNKPGARLPGRGRPVGATGSIGRVDLLNDNTAKVRKHTLATLTGAMNAAATQDVRAMKFVPLLARLLKGGTPPSARATRMLELLEEWRAQGGSRLDRDLDGKIDHPGAAILDTAWNRLADAAMTPVLGKPLADQLARPCTAASTSRRTATVRRLAHVHGQGHPLAARRAAVTAPFANRYCGSGDVNVCRAALWAALEAAGVELEAAQGSDPAAWRADANRERISFAARPAHVHDALHEPAERDPAGDRLHGAPVGPRAGSATLRARTKTCIEGGLDRAAHSRWQANVAFSATPDCHLAAGARPSMQVVPDTVS